MRAFFWLGFLGSFLSSYTAQAGWLVSTGVGWSFLSARSEQGEPTLTQQGVTFRGVLGYSAERILDFALYGASTPFRSQVPRFENGDTHLSLYGAHLGFRIKGALLVAFRGGQTLLKDLKQDLESSSHGETRFASSSTFPTKWKGSFAEVFFGGLCPLSKQNALEIGWAWAYLQLLPQISEEKDMSSPRFLKMDQMSLHVGYTFNSVPKSHL